MFLNYLLSNDFSIMAQSRWMEDDSLAEPVEVAASLGELNHQLGEEPAEASSSNSTDLAFDAMPFHSLFKQAAVGMVIADLDYRLLEVNPAFCNLLGYSATELQFRRFEEITHPDDWEAAWNHLQKSILESKAILRWKSAICGAMARSSGQTQPSRHSMLPLAFCNTTQSLCTILVSSKSCCASAVWQSRRVKKNFAN
ncbi:MAG: PAS domain S-box protein [Cyanobacteria bacterium RM1_2_2]|nr:PAS domain S-box protein [Cyanobacteria bacterium RM1_2_2]